MKKLYRGDVIIAWCPDGYDDKGKPKLKTRHVIVNRDARKDSDVVTVYCTKQNNGNDRSNIFVPCDSEEGENMGLWEDTYIRTDTILTIKTEFIVRPVGKCSLMQEISKKIDDQMAR